MFLTKLNSKFKTISYSFIDRKSNITRSNRDVKLIIGKDINATQLKSSDE